MKRRNWKIPLNNRMLEELVTDVTFDQILRGDLPWTDPQDNNGITF